MPSKLHSLALGVLLILAIALTGTAQAACQYAVPNTLRSVNLANINAILLDSPTAPQALIVRPAFGQDNAITINGGTYSSLTEANAAFGALQKVANSCNGGRVPRSVCVYLFPNRRGLINLASLSEATVVKTNPSAFDASGAAITVRSTTQAAAYVLQLTLMAQNAYGTVIKSIPVATVTEASTLLESMDTFSQTSNCR